MNFSSDSDYLQGKRIACQEENCGEKFERICGLRLHLAEKHGLKDFLISKNLTFDTKCAFLEWLDQEGKKTNSKFILLYSPRQRSDHVYQAYRCNRSGFCLWKRHRKLTAAEIAEMYNFCTAGVTVRAYDDRIEVVYYDSHYKHKNELEDKTTKADNSSVPCPTDSDNSSVPCPTDSDYSNVPWPPISGYKNLFKDAKNRKPVGHKHARGNLRCSECNIYFCTRGQLRGHLGSVHNADVTEQIHVFPSMDAFKKWKQDLERKELVSFTVRHGARKTALGKKTFYVCHRSGKFVPKVEKGHRQRMLRAQGTVKLGIECTAAIYCEERENEVHVKYCPYHYGHGKETLFIQLSTDEQAAIQENVSKGIPFESLLNDIRDGQSANDRFQVGLLKKRDIRFINNAFNVGDYNNGISDADSINLWVQQCCQMEDSPILFYRQEDPYSNEDFILVIMTEFQKQMLISSERQVVCIDSLYRQPKGGRFYLTIIFTMDECEMAFPVAYCVSSKVDKDVMVQFLTSIHDSTGPLTCQYFMSDNLDFHYNAWVEVMGDTNCRWLWSTWYVDSAIRTQLKIFKGNLAKRAEVYKKVRMLLECQNVDVFNTLLKNYVEQLLSDDSSRPLGQFIMNKYGSNTEMWAHCHRKEIKLSTNVHLEVIHRTFKYTCREGRKKRLDKFIFVIMKLLRYKMLDRLSNMLDEEKINMAVEAINNCHSAGLEITADRISSLSDTIWLIHSEDEGDVFIVREFESCPERCTLRCSECDICVHMYSCSCVQNMINANLCHHIHAVVWKFVTPHFSPPPSPAADYSNTNDYDDVDNEPPVLPDKSSELLESVLKRTHDVYKKVRSSTCTLNRQTLTTIMGKLNECIDLCNRKLPEVPEEEESSEQPPSPPQSLPISFLQSPQSLVQLPTSQQPIQLNSPNVVYVINQYGRKPLETSFLQSQLANIVQGNKTSQVPQ